MLIVEEGDNRPLPITGARLLLPGDVVGQGARLRHEAIDAENDGGRRVPAVRSDRPGGVVDIDGKSQ